MTPLVLHGLVPGTAPVPDDPPTHERLDLGDIVALISTQDLDRDDARMIDAAVEHHMLLAHYAMHVDVLPVRFGTVFSSRPAVTRAVATAQPALLAELERLKDQQEFILVLRNESIPRAAAPPVKDGRAFLAEKSRARDARKSLSVRRRDFVETTAGHLNDAATDVLTLDCKTADQAAGFALLMDRAAAPALVETIRTLGAEADPLGLTLVLTGPGPCYSFAAEHLTGRVNADA